MQTRDGFTLRAWFLQPVQPNGDSVLLLHGLGDNRAGMRGFADLFLRHGYSVLLPDARAQGASGGTLATFGLLESQDILLWNNWLHTEKKSNCVFGLGESMGAAQLLQSLSVQPDFCAVVAESSYSSFREIAYDRMGQPFHMGPWIGRTLFRPLVESAFLYVRFKYGLNMTAISPEEAVARSTVPVLLIHGGSDTNVPLRHSEQIFANSQTVAGNSTRVVLWVVPGAEHTGSFGQEPEEFERRVTEWFAGHGRVGAPSKN